MHAPIWRLYNRVSYDTLPLLKHFLKYTTRTDNNLQLPVTIRVHCEMFHLYYRSRDHMSACGECHSLYLSLCRAAVIIFHPLRLCHPDHVRLLHASRHLILQQRPPPQHLEPVPSVQLLPLLTCSDHDRRI